MGYFAALSESPGAMPAFQEGLASQGWIVGKSVQIVEVRTADDAESIQQGIDELVALQPDAIYAFTAPRARPLLARVTDIPVVFSNTTDPVENGLMDNIGRPTGNATGFYFPSGYEKRIQVLLDVFPDMERLGYLYHAPTTNPVLVQLGVEALAEFDGEVTLLGVNEPGEILADFASAPGAGLLVDANVEFFINRRAVIDAVNAAAIPAIYYWSIQAEDGGLMSYGADPVDPRRQAGAYIGRILNGAEISDLPAQASTKFNLVLNLATAEQQDITFPPELLATADLVVE